MIKTFNLNKCIAVLSPNPHTVSIYFQNRFFGAHKLATFVKEEA